MGGKPSHADIRRTTIEKRNAQLEKFIPILKQIIEESGLTAEKVEQVISQDVPGLVNYLNNKVITSVQLVAIFGLRAATIGRRNCIITEDYFQYALKKAKECDEVRTSTGKNNWTLSQQYDSEKYLPPLFGIPVSIKDNIEMAGTRSTIGLTARAEKVIEADNCIVICAKNSGMIPFVKTNLPQIALNYDSHNFLWGRCINPWNSAKSAGGSSGGEGAAVASKISPIGIGNDMLGSVRIPAMFNGVVGLMSSPGRLPMLNTTSSYSRAFGGMDTIKIITGPLSKSVEGAALWMKAMTTESFYAGQYDPYNKLIPFDQRAYNETLNSKQKLRIGYIQTLELIQTSPAVNRGLLETVEFLKSEGHQLIEIHVPNQKEVLLVPFYEMIGEGNMAAFTEMLENEPLVPQYQNFEKITKMNTYLFKIIKFLLNRFQPRVGTVLSACQKLTTHQYLQKVGRFYELRKDWIDYWRKNRLDFVICPGFGLAATDHGFSKECDLIAAYTYIWNVFAMVSCSLPVTVTRQDEQYYESHWEDEFTKAIKRTVGTSKGLPVNVQVVGMPFSEEKVLGLARKIERHFQFTQKYELPLIKE